MAEQPEADASISRSEAIAQLDRILASQGFVDSPRLSRFLTYVSEHSLSDEPGSLKESVIGAEVFDRTEFDPGSDSVVRSNARRLRQRLAAYYAGEGNSDPLRLEMPKGHYRVLFSRNGRAFTWLGLPGGWLRSAAMGLVGLAVAGSVFGLFQLQSRITAEGQPSLSDRAMELGVVTISVEVDGSEALPYSVRQRVEHQLIVALTEYSPFQIRRIDTTVPERRAFEESSYRLQGNLLTADNHAELSLQLVSSSTGRTLWPETVELDERGLGKAGYVALSVRSAVQLDLLKKQTFPGFRDSRAKSLYLYALERTYLTHQPGERDEHQRAAVLALREAARLDPDTPPVWSQLASVYADAGWLDSQERSRLAHDAAQRGLELATRSHLPVAQSFAHLTAGRIEFELNRNFSAAWWHYETAREFGHESPIVENHLGQVDRMAGRLEAAAARFQTAREMDKGAVDPWALLDLSTTLLYLGRYRKSLVLLDELDGILAPARESDPVPWLRIIALARLGEQQNARAIYQELVNRSPIVPARTLVGWMPLVGEADAAEKALRFLDADWMNGKRFPCRHPLVGSWLLGDKEGMYRWLDRALEREEVIPRLYGVEFQVLRSESRFTRALERMREPKAGAEAPAFASQAALALSLSTGRD